MAAVGLIKLRGTLKLGSFSIGFHEIFNLNEVLIWRTFRTTRIVFHRRLKIRDVFKSVSYRRLKIRDASRVCPSGD